MTEQTIYIEGTAIGFDEMVNHHVAAKILGLSPRTVQNLTLQKAFPYYRLSGRCRRYLVRDLINWYEEKRVISENLAA